MSTLDVRADVSIDALPPTLTVREAFDFDVAIVGLGYVGLPTALAYFAAGSRVLALDASPKRLRVIASRAADLIDSDRGRLEDALRTPKGFRLTTDATELSRAAAVIVCVPTPVDHQQVPDLVPLRAACATVVAAARPGQLIMLTSTTYVGCTHDLVEEPLRARGLHIGSDVFVTFSAERIDPGNIGIAQEAVPRVVGGATPQCEEEGARLLSRYAARVHRVSSLATAEMTKLLENTFRAVNIALANEFADICGALDVPITEVIEAASTKPYGFMAFYPGPGVGGHCIPCDPHYLLWQLRALRVDAGVITQAMTRIAARPGRVVDRVRDVLGRAGKGTLGARVLVVGVTYKPDVADLRESPALEIIDGLLDLGAEVQYVDTHAPHVDLASGRARDSLADPAVFHPDVVLVHTRHQDADLTWIEADAVVLDGTYRSGDLVGRVLL
ncbi:nucleotide sugar dehydrogenase [Microbacterium enclense]|uniref:nucleotide sugar dehydrogenase n=1 Tax=Microbacterium enclense TaxID=993073 RepID=UPI0036DCF113